MLIMIYSTTTILFLVSILSLGQVLIKSLETKNVCVCSHHPYLCLLQLHVHVLHSEFLRLPSPELITT